VRGRLSSRGRGVGAQHAAPLRIASEAIGVLIAQIAHVWAYSERCELEAKNGEDQTGS
jgi:hypothetical protein